MPDIKHHVDRALESLYFSGARIDEHLASFVRDRGDACRAIGRERAGKFSHLYLAGSGGSFACLQTAKYILDSVLDVPCDVVLSYELHWRLPLRLNNDSLVVLASFSGETEDTVAALRWAKQRGAYTIGIVGGTECTMAREADAVIDYRSGAIYELPIVALILLAAGLEERRGAARRADDLVQGIADLPPILRRTLGVERHLAESKARELLRAQHVFVLGSGPLGPLAYKLAMNVVMENVRIAASFSDATEWRHGPAEALERLRGDFIVLLGTDASRDVTMRTIDFCRSQKSQVLVYDAAEFGRVHPLLTPLVMNSHTQWLIVYWAILRGITDVDERVFMGRNVLAASGAQWP